MVACSSTGSWLANDEDDRAGRRTVHEVPALGGSQVDHRPIVQNQHADLGHLARSGSHPVAKPRDSKVVKQARRHI